MTWVIKLEAPNLEKSLNSILNQSNVKRWNWKKHLIMQKDFKKHNN
jgi:hypothetical protein